MRAVAWGIIASLLFPAIAWGQAFAPMQYIPMGGYRGPGDIIAFTVWYSCTRGYSKAYAQPGTNVACLIEKASATGTLETWSPCTVYIRPNGNVDLDTTLACDSGTTTVNTWGAPRLYPNATGTGSSSGTTLHISSVSSGQYLVDMAIDTVGVHIVSQINGTPGGAGDYQLSGSYSAGSGTRTARAPLIRLNTVYDQTLNAACGGSCDLVIESGVAKTLFAWGTDGFCTGISGLPCATNNHSLITSFTQSYLSASTISPSSPMGLAAVGTDISGTDQWVQCGGWASSSSPFNSIAAGFAAGNWYTGNNVAPVSASDGSGHSAVASLVNPGNATLYVDGNSNSVSVGGGVNAAAAQVKLFKRASQHFFDWNEGGCRIGNDFSTVAAALLANEKAYYHTP